MAEMNGGKTRNEDASRASHEPKPLRWPSLGHQIIDRLRNRESVVIIDARSGREWTGTRLSEVILNVSTALIDKHDLKSGDTVCIRYQNSDLTHILAMAVICAGGIVVNGYPKDPYDLSWKGQLEADLGYELTAIAMDPGEGHEYHLDNYMSYERTKSQSFGKVPVACEDATRHVALITLSSGSTGLPKTIPTTHYSSSSCSENFKREDIEFEGHRYSCSSGLDYISAKILLFGVIELSATLVILDSAEPVFFSRSIEKYKINVIWLGAAAFYNLMTCSEIENCDISSIKMITPFGAKLSYIDELRVFVSKHPHITKICQVYGSTEMSIIASTKATRSDFFKYPDLGCKLYPGYQVKVVDKATGEIMGPNEQGLLYVKGSTVTRGYYDISNLKTNGDPFVRPKDAFDGDGFFGSGDIVYIDEKSAIHVIGRDCEVMWCRPLRKVLPHELEVVIGDHFAVSKVVVYGKPHKRHPSQHCPRAFIAVKEELYRNHQVELPEIPKVDDEALEFKGTNKLCSLPDNFRRSLAKNIMLYTNQMVGWEKQLIGGVILVDDIPVLRSGKANKTYLKSLDMDQIEVYGERSD